MIDAPQKRINNSLLGLECPADLVNQAAEISEISAYGTEQLFAAVVAQLPEAVPVTTLPCFHSR